MRPNRSPLIFIILGITLFLGCIVSVWAEVEPTGDLVATETWDFGYLPQKCTVSHTFFVHNHDAAPIVVREIKAGCSCTSTSSIDDPIAPADSAAVTVTFKSGRYQNTIRKTTKVFVEGCEEPAYKLTVVANVMKKDKPAGQISLDPWRPVWSLSDSTADTVRNLVTVTNDGPIAVSLEIVATSPEIILAEIASELPAGETTVLRVTMDKLSTEPNEGLASVTLLVRGQDTSRVTIPVTFSDE